MLKKIDDLLFKILHLVILGFLLYGGLIYASGSTATLMLGFISVLLLVFLILDFLFKLNDNHINRKIDKYYR